MSSATLAPPRLDRQAIAALVVERLEQSKEAIAAEFSRADRLQAAIIDDLLPAPVAAQIAAAFPAAEQMRLQHSLREQKFTAKQLDLFDPWIAETLFAFQDPRVVAKVEQITGLQAMQPDPNLYAGGISLMRRGQFLLPHLDNSHDKDRQVYRVLNLLYYVTPGWEGDSGGNLELWDQGPNGAPREIVSRFNRLVLMATHQSSWHSVNEVRSVTPRTCISNYYFSPHPPTPRPYFHVTSFRARPGQHLRDWVLRVDGALRTGLRRVVRRGIYQPEVYSGTAPGQDT